MEHFVELILKIVAASDEVKRTGWAPQEFFPLRVDSVLLETFPIVVAMAEEDSWEVDLGSLTVR